jgi:septal ring factor EnvC (AmiA/AmiB activator)
VISLELIKIVAASGTIGTVIGGAFTLAAKKVSSPDRIAASQADLVTALTAQTKTLLADSAKDRRLLARRVHSQGREIKRISLEVSECQDRHEDCEMRVEDLKNKVEKLEDTLNAPN